MKYLWKVYYFFVRPSSKTGIAIRYCRCNNKPYKKLKFTREFKEEDDL